MIPWSFTISGTAKSDSIISDAELDALFEITVPSPPLTEAEQTGAAMAEKAWRETYPDMFPPALPGEPKPITWREFI